jgi:uncharacterized protein YchJ
MSKQNDAIYSKYPARKGFRRIENRWVYTDSEMEARIIRRLVTHGFSGRWHRYGFGISASLFRYTPDVHLSIMHDSMIRRALVEFKPVSAGQFSKKQRLRMLSASKFFKDALCMLYVERTKQWYFIEADGELQKTTEPTPGTIPIARLPRPRLMVPTYNPITGRMYWERPGMFILRKTLDGVGYVARELTGRRKRR